MLLVDAINSLTSFIVSAFSLLTQ